MHTSRTDHASLLSSACMEAEGGRAAPGNGVLEGGRSAPGVHSKRVENRSLRSCSAPMVSESHVENRSLRSCPRNPDRRESANSLPKGVGQLVDVLIMPQQDGHDRSTGPSDARKRSYTSGPAGKSRHAVRDLRMQRKRSYTSDPAGKSRHAIQDLQMLLSPKVLESVSDVGSRWLKPTANQGNGAKAGQVTR